MATGERRVAQWLPAARSGDGQALGEVLESCRAYLLWIAERELVTQEEPLREEWQALRGVFTSSGPEPQGLDALRRAVRECNELLVERIREGTFDELERFRRGCRTLRPIVERKLRVANPRYLAATGTAGREKP